MLIKSHWSFVALAILWEIGLRVFAPHWWAFQDYIGLSCVVGLALTKVLTRPCVHCGTPVGCLARRCPACNQPPRAAKGAPSC